ncbi:MAG: hypothetical protein M2R45_01579 [Verrucomicrobia subdivision 3 bacterium]|nr:hypothetical protein [Limisphaerales bacterium]MCS1412732.1 hypothetical protein [Limisphaerales bacterium]
MLQCKTLLCQFPILVKTAFTPSCGVKYVIPFVILGNVKYNLLQTGDGPYEHPCEKEERVGQ